MQRWKEWSKRSGVGWKIIGTAVRDPKGHPFGCDEADPGGMRNLNGKNKPIVDILLWGFPFGH